MTGQNIMVIMANRSIIIRISIHKISISGNNVKDDIPHLQDKKVLGKIDMYFQVVQAFFKISRTSLSVRSYQFVYASATAKENPVLTLRHSSSSVSGRM